MQPSSERCGRVCMDEMDLCCEVFYDSTVLCLPIFSFS